MTATHAEAIRAMQAEATEASDKRRRTRWTSALKVLGLVLLLAAIAS